MSDLFSLDSGELGLGIGELPWGEMLKEGQNEELRREDTDEFFAECFPWLCSKERAGVYAEGVPRPSPAHAPALAGLVHRQQQQQQQQALPDPSATSHPACHQVSQSGSPTASNESTTPAEPVVAGLEQQMGSHASWVSWRALSQGHTGNSDPLPITSWRALSHDQSSGIGLLRLSSGCGVSRAQASSTQLISPNRSATDTVRARAAAKGPCAMPNIPALDQLAPAHTATTRNSGMSFNAHPFQAASAPGARCADCAMPGVPVPPTPASSPGGTMAQTGPAVPAYQPLLPFQMAGCQQGRACEDEAMQDIKAEPELGGDPSPTLAKRVSWPMSCPIQTVQPASVQKSASNRTESWGWGSNHSTPKCMPAPDAQTPKRVTLAQALSAEDPVITQAKGRSSYGSSPRKAKGPIRKRNSSSSGGGGGAKSGSRRSGWDTACRKYEEIARLESLMAEKMTLAAQLEAENADLARRERLLKLQVLNDERNLKYQKVQDIAPHLKLLLQSFRSSVNRAHAGELMSQMPREVKDFTSKEFIMVWKSFMAEVSDIMAEGTSLGQTELVQQRSEEFGERLMNWLMLLCVSKFILLPEVHVLSMHTGEMLIQPIEFWREVVEKLGLTEQQLSDLNATYNLYGGLLQDVFAQISQHMLQLTELVNADLQGSHDDLHVGGTCAWSRSMDRKEAAIKRLQGLFRRYHLLHIMSSFLVLGLLTAWQRCCLISHCTPSYPNFKLILRAVHTKVQGAGSAHKKPMHG